jgi:predicted ArsR family transcriptional regulator
MDRATSPDPDAIEAIALLGEPNRRKLHAYATSSPRPVSRDEAAEALGISRELAAHHLDRLVEGGLLATEWRPRDPGQGPGAGRPAKLYRRAPRELAVSLPDRRYEAAARAFAAALVASPGGPDLVAHGAAARGEAFGAAVRRRVGRRPSRSRLLTTLLEALRGAGYEPRVEPKAGVVSLTNCPFDRLATDYRDLTCGMNRAWAEGVGEGIGGHIVAAAAVDPVGRCCAEFHLGPERTRGRPAPTL